MSRIYWSGPRESDITYAEDMFAGSFTFYGSNVDSNYSFCCGNDIRINHNLFNQNASDFILAHQLKCIREDPECYFMSYNPNCVFGAPNEIVERTLCLNDEQLMAQLDNKLFFREFAKALVPTLPMQVIVGHDCKYTMLLQQFPLFDAFVIQEPVSSGGQGTYLMCAENAEEVIGLLDAEESYIVTGFIDSNIPVNLHAVIYDDEIALFPGSVQIIQFGNHRLLYRGADYPTFRGIDLHIREALYNFSLVLLKEVQTLGYRGVLGVDALISGDHVYITEINNRFQGSSILLNRALSEHGWESLQRMNLAAFSGIEPDKAHLKELQQMDVPYSMYTYVQEGDNEHSRYIFERALRETVVDTVLTEGYDPDQPAQPYASQFSILFRGNITSICPGECKVRLHPNIASPSQAWKAKILSNDLTALKTALINRGVVLSEAAKRFIHEHGDMREGTYFSLDLFLRGVYINSPLYVKLAGLSPFEVDFSENEGLFLKFYGHRIARVDYDRKEPLPKGPTEDTPPIDRILFLATDRLRVQNNSYCTFAKNGVVCKFCEANGQNNAFSEQDILDSLDLLFTADNRPKFRHVLVGGLSNDIGLEQKTILDICHKLRDYSDMPIYLMCLPPAADDIRRYYQAGVTEFGFNIEIFDRSIARRFMPGKGRIPLQRYMDALEEAVKCCGHTGAVRTAFIVGLEPMSSLLKGIDAVCQIGVSPILSAFRPIPGTEMSGFIPPSDEWLYEALMRSEEICKKYGLTLGPECPACRNNTLTLAQADEVVKIYSSAWRRTN